MIDQDGIELEPLVWFGSGNIMGNQVTVVIRHWNSFCQWTVYIETALGETIAQAGVAANYELAVMHAQVAIRDLLEVDWRDS